MKSEVRPRALFKGIRRHYKKIGLIIYVQICAYLMMALGSQAIAGEGNSEQVSFRECNTAEDCTSGIDNKRWVIFEVSGKKLAVPREYGGAAGALEFYWPSRQPGNAVTNKAITPELNFDTHGRIKNAYEALIEIFIAQKKDDVIPDFKRLQQADGEGRVLRRRELDNDLDVWEVYEGYDTRRRFIPTRWYVAKRIRGLDGLPPVIHCHPGDRQIDTCSTSFSWKYDSVVSVRFHAKNAGDWVEIHHEIENALNKVKEVKEVKDGRVLFLH